MKTYKLQKEKFFRQVMASQGERIKALRIDADLSFSQVSRLTRIPETNLKYAERSKRFLTIPELMLLSGLYSVSVDWIINGGPLRRPLKSAIDNLPTAIQHAMS